MEDILTVLIFLLLLEFEVFGDVEAEPTPHIDFLILLPSLHLLFYLLLQPQQFPLLRLLIRFAALIHFLKLLQDQALLQGRPIFLCHHYKTYIQIYLLSQLIHNSPHRWLNQPNCLSSSKLAS